MTDATDSNSETVLVGVAIVDEVIVQLVGDDNDVPVTSELPMFRLELITILSVIVGEGTS